MPFHQHTLPNGLQLIGEAGLASRLEFYPEASEIALPRFLSEKRQTCSHDPQEGYKEFVLHQFRELTTVSRRRQGVQGEAQARQREA